MPKSTDKKNLHVGHRERMRDRFADVGFDSYRPHEVLEQMLYHPLPRVNTNEIAHQLLDRCGDLIDVLHADRDELMNIPGVGDKTADYIKSIIPRVTDLIIRQYRELSELNIYNIAFLGDWFFRLCGYNGIGIVICDADRRFLDFRLTDYITDDGELDPYSIGEIIVKRFLCERYYVLSRKNDPYVTRENMLKLRDYTSRLGSFMMDAYQMQGMQPISYLYI